MKIVKDGYSLATGNPAVCALAVAAHLPPIGEDVPAMGAGRDIPKDGET